jgi:hypothetical protein
MGAEVHGAILLEILRWVFECELDIDGFWTELKDCLWMYRLGYEMQACDVCRASNPGLLLYDRDYASAPCALLPLPTPTARTSNVIAVYVTSLDAPGLSTTSEFCLG